MVSVSNSPSIERMDDNTLKMTFKDNGTISADTVSSVAKKSMPEVKVVSAYVSANCTKDIYFYRETLYAPEYYIFAPNLSGKDCICPSGGMYWKAAWKYYMFGYLYQPTKAYSVNTGFVDYDKCLATNCYTSGLMPMNEVSFVHPNQEWQPSYDANIVVYVGDERNELNFNEETIERKVGNLTVQYKPELICDAGDVVIYNNEVKPYWRYMEIMMDTERAETDFKYRIENRDYMTGKINDFLKDEVEGCSVMDNKAVCAPTKESGITTVFLNLS